MTKPEMAPLERLAIVQACTELVARFAHAIDARDNDALASMFVADGVFCRPTAPDDAVRGRETIRARFAARPAGKLTRHLCLNTVVTVLNAEEAQAVSYILLYTGDHPEGASLPIKADAKQLLGAFHDRMVRDSDGVWKFRERRGSLSMTIGG